MLWLLMRNVFGKYAETFLAGALGARKSLCTSRAEQILSERLEFNNAPSKRETHKEPKSI
jgi:hypothetical protein